MIERTVAERADYLSKRRARDAAVPGAYLPVAAGRLLYDREGGSNRLRPLKISALARSPRSFCWRHSQRRASWLQPKRGPAIHQRREHARPTATMRCGGASSFRWPRRSASAVSTMFDHGQSPRGDPHHHVHWPCGCPHPLGISSTALTARIDGMAERLANRLKERRTELGLTQAELAEQVCVTAQDRQHG